MIRQNHWLNDPGKPGRLFGLFRLQRELFSATGYLATRNPMPWEQEQCFRPQPLIVLRVVHEMVGFNAGRHYGAIIHLYVSRRGVPQVPSATARSLWWHLAQHIRSDTTQSGNKVPVQPKYSLTGGLQWALADVRGIPVCHKRYTVYVFGRWWTSMESGGQD